jgi:hypothetical protein
MMLSDKHRFAFSAITKTATQSVLQVLREHYHGYLEGGVAMHSMKPPARAAEYFTFTVCRNPYDRAVSLWWSTCKRDVDKYGFRAKCPRADDFTSFMKWVATTRPDHELTRPQWLHIHGVRIDRVLRFEHLADDFKSLPFYSGEPAEWPRNNTTIENRLPWQQYMSRDSVRWIHEWCGLDFDKFGYERIEWS